MLKSKIILLSIFQLFIINLFAQENEINLREKALNIIIDCDYCDLEYIKREISFVNYVRDTKEAEVHILISQQDAGNGGEKYSFYFIAQKDYSGK